jgi:lysozyme
MVTSDKGIALIKKWEQLRLSAYLDAPSTSIWTIGYGHTKGVTSRDFIDEIQADKFLREDLMEVEAQINHYLRDVALTQNEFDALVSLVFNVGSGTIFTKRYNNGYAKGSTLYNLLLQGKKEKAGQHFTDFVKAGGQVLQGLVNRRKDEQNMFLKKKVCSYCGQFL